MEYWTAEGIIRGLTRSDDCPPSEIFDNMFLIVEEQAKQVLEENGYGVHEWYLTDGDPEADRREWLNEALHLLDYDLDFELEQAAILLIESSKLQDFLAENQADQAALSASKIIAITLLPNDTELTAICENYKSRPSKGGKKPKRSKGILTACARIRKDNPSMSAAYCWEQLLKIVEDGDEIEIESDDGSCFSLETQSYPIKSKDPKLDGTDATRIISIDERTGGQDGRPVTLSTVQNWFTEDNKTNIFSHYS